MENPEEVLQALEEFQKMRPTEIPRELDEYINFVAKTGDSVYQWPLVKPLFREKLVRVMTDFYENCPTLDLVSSPNIEHFNYDIMKCNLLDLLESFANAPFTIQRLCELLTSPRKEYNRVDKFMRAIEKNILVVSTREPGVAGRRSENGDSMVNGSIDDDSTTVTQQSNDEIETKTWDKNSPTTTTDTNVDDNTPLPTQDQDDPTMPLKMTKNTNDNSQTVNDKQDDKSIDNLTPENNEILSTQGILTSSITESLICPNDDDDDNLATNIGEIVPDAIVNEDTSSQPISDVDNDENETKEKLQTTFHPDDFTDTSDDKTVLNNLLKNDEDKKTDVINEAVDESIVKADCEDKISSFDQEAKLITESDNSNEPSGLESNELSSKTDKNECLTKANCSVITTITPTKKEIEPESRDEKEKIDEDKIEQDLESKPLIEEKSSPIVENVTESLPSSETQEICSAKIDEKIVKETLVEASKPIVEEASIETDEKIVDDGEKVEEENKFVIEEVMNDDTTVMSNLVPDPIPIVEEPKDEIPSIVEPTVVDSVVTVEEKEENNSIELKKEQETPTEASELKNDDKVLEASVTTPSDCQENTNIEAAEKINPAESMEVDSEDSMSAIQQDEPMDEECSYQTRS